MAYGCVRFWICEREGCACVRESVRTYVHVPARVYALRRQKQTQNNKFSYNRVSVFKSAASSPVVVLSPFLRTRSAKRTVELSIIVMEICTGVAHASSHIDLH